MSIFIAHRLIKLCSVSFFISSSRTLVFALSVVQAIADGEFYLLRVVFGGTILLDVFVIHPGCIAHCVEDVVVFQEHGPFAMGQFLVKAGIHKSCRAETHVLSITCARPVAVDAEQEVGRQCKSVVA